MSNGISPILVTGAAGFIGSETCIKLLDNGHKVIGIDNLSDYYDVTLKNSRLKKIELINKSNSWLFLNGSIDNFEFINETFKLHKPKVVINLAAQAGVRYSLTNPSVYIKTNLIGFFNVIDACKTYKIENLIYASSSSVYGGNKKLPFSEDNEVNHPISLYAATKRSNELIAHSYSYNYEIPCTGLRFFTVYGPFGRPDMAPMIFTKSILKGDTIDIFNFGKMNRDFTYIDDVIESIYRCCFKPASKDKNFDSFYPNCSTSFAPHRIFNVGNSKPVKLMEFIKVLEDKIGKKAVINYKPLQMGDVLETFADSSKLRNWINYSPSISIEVGIKHFVDWYLDYYSIIK